MSDITVISNRIAVGNAVEKAMKEAAEMIGGSLSGHAAEEAPVDTGLLRNSITYAVGGEGTAIKEYTDDNGVQIGYYKGTAPEDKDNEVTVYVGTNVEYAPYQELGAPSINLPARPYLRPAFEHNNREILRIIQTAFKAVK